MQAMGYGDDPPGTAGLLQSGRQAPLTESEESEVPENVVLLPGPLQESKAGARAPPSHMMFCLSSVTNSSKSHKLA